MSPDPVRHPDTIIFPASLDPQAVSVVRRLREAGYESYLVGGCVRDLLLGHIPKDFDASTEARPRQIRRVFRNCRVIGRRFKLAHVHFGSHIIEVATFRKNPTESNDPPGSDDDESGDSGELSVRESDSDSDTDPDADDLLITRDNVYGTSEEDTLRRDFTINALLYDVLTDEVIDYVGGVKDVENKILRTIGDPMIRIAEDPVRMLRAVKFTARLGLTMHPDLDAAMHACAELIDRSAPPRVLEEIYKMLTCGAAARALELLQGYGLLERLLPELADYWKQKPEELVRLGAALDHVDRAQRQVDNSFVLALLFHDVWHQQLEEAERLDPLIAARDLIAPAAQRMNIPRRDVSTATQMLLNQSRLERSRRGRRFRMADFLARDSTVKALDLMYVRCLAGLADPECHARWTMRLAEHHGLDSVPGAPSARNEREEQSEDGRGPRKRRRRGGRRRSGSRRGSGRGESGPSDENTDETAPQSRETRRPAEDGAADSPTSRDDDSQASDDSASGPRRRRSRSRGGRRSRSDSGAGSGSGEARAKWQAGTETKDDARAPVAEENHGATQDRGSRPAPVETPPAKPAAPSTDAASTGAGITGRLKGLLRRVIGRSQPAGSETAASSAASASATARQQKPSSGTPEDRQPQKPDVNTEDKADAARGGQPKQGDGSQDETGSGSPRKRRPRRRRRGGAARDVRAGSEDTAGAQEGSATGDRVETSGDEDSSSSGEGGKRAPRRRSRSGSASGGGSRKKSSGTSGRASGGRKSSRPKTRTSGKTSAESKPSEESKPDPSGRHPEDVEDMFDW